MNKKTQFSELIKIEKNKLQSLEREIQRERAEILKLQNEIQEIEDEILKIDYPTTGTFSMLQQFNIAMHNMKREVQNRHGKIDASHRRLEKLKSDMILVEHEIEKYKFLENEILKKRKLEERKREEKDIDEIATILHNLKKEL